MREKPTIRSSTKQKISIQDLVRPAPVSYIVPNLYLGDKNAAADRDELQKLKITHIVNCARDLPDRFPVAPTAGVCHSPRRSSAALSSSTTTHQSRSSSSPEGQSDEEMCDADDMFDSASSSSVATGSFDEGEKPEGVEWSGPVAYHRVELVDSSRSEAAFEEALEQVFAFVDAAMVAGGAGGGNGVVLIHCCAGRSRAPAVMIAYLMYRYKWPLDKAYALVCQARPAVCPNRGFLQVLLRLEKRLLGVNSMRLRNNGRHHSLVSVVSDPSRSSGKLALY